MSDGPENSRDLDELIREAYRIVGEPARLGELQERIERSTADFGQGGASLDEHFAQAGRLFDALPEKEARDFSNFGYDRETVLSSGRTGTLLRLDADLAIAAIDDQSLRATELSVGDAFDEWLSGDSEETRQALGDLTREGSGKSAHVVRFYSSTDDQRGILGLAVRAGPKDNAAILVRQMGLRWSERDRNAFASAFALTETEGELVRFLVEARSVADFAESRGRSLATARTQLKRLQQKLAVASQGEIISLYAGFVGLLASDAVAAGMTASAPKTGIVRLRDEELRYERHGLRGGEPVLMLHGALEGPFLPESVIAAANAAGIEIFSPWMPFYTGSESDLPAAERIESFAGKLPGFLDALGIQRCRLLACSLSTAYAFAALARHPGRFSGLVLSGMAMPLSEIEDRRSMNAAWRAPLELGSRFPRFFELFARAVFRLALRGEVHQFFDRLFKDSPADLATMRDPEVARVMRYAAEHRPDRFGAAMAHGFAVMTADWRPWLASIDRPVRLVFGAEDTVVQPAQMQAFAARHAIAAVGPLNGVAGYSLFQAPEIVFAELHALPD